jgi:hypothetical protein
MLLRAPEKERKRDRNERQASAVEKHFAEADARLRALAQASAGQVYFPESAADLDRIYAEIGERLRNLYSLAYTPANAARDGSFRRITVELVDENGAPLGAGEAGGASTFRVFARPGYYAPRE